MPASESPTENAPGSDTPWRPTLLVVDDQPLNIRALYESLSASYRVLMATSGAKALALCRDEPPDLVLLDVVMPDLDGHEVCRRLKADAATRSIPVIFVTAHDDPAEEARGLALGAVDFIAKPISPAVVQARVKTHLELGRSSALLAATLEATADGILVTDLEGRIRTFNQRFACMWNLPAALRSQPQTAPILAHMQAQTGRVGHVEAGPESAEFMHIELRDGRCLERCEISLHTHGQRSGRVFSYREVTERRRAERALAELNATLESRILERTRELEQARVQADAANQAKSDFLSNMSHEIRTPMNSILGMAYLALRATQDPKQRDYLQKISQSGQHLLGIINDILDFSKIEAGKLELDVTVFEIESVFANVVDQLGHAAEKKGLRLLLELDPRLSRPVGGDALRLGQALLNYVGNAIKFSDAGDIALRATLVEQEGAGALVRFEVQDQGIGMTDAQAATLFHSFQQADASTTRKHGGTGLGLAICKQLAGLMGGEVGVTSRPGMGSRFWLTARLGWPAQARFVAMAAAEPEPEVVTGLRGRSILVVDDNLFNQQVAAELLEAEGAAVAIAGDGQEALDRLHQRRFDCVLMDVQMPVMDGLQATRMIRANPAWAGMPVIAMTANARQEDRLKCLDAGMNDFLTKPVSRDLLCETIARWLAPTVAVPRPANPLPQVDAKV